MVVSAFVNPNPLVFRLWKTKPEPIVFVNPKPPKIHSLSSGCPLHWFRSIVLVYEVNNHISFIRHELIHLIYRDLAAFVNPSKKFVTVNAIIVHMQTHPMEQFMRPEDIRVQYEGVNQPSDLWNGPPKPAFEFTIKRGDRVNIPIEGIDVITHPHSL
ncbi:hypothetical protein RJT34_20621 [Clitoria ternatea]|uniref:Uncharacterized protein n=1 Tax=Clitoria ternatea TaxID=43366 RepID=A0AAN9ITF7_CLITE